MASPKSVDASLWWEPFAPILTELENASLSSDLPPPLAKKLKDNHAWFVDTLSLYKKPNEKSREALNSQQVKIGSQLLTIKPELKDKALQISSYLHLDEVQSYILVERSTKHKNIAVDSMVQEFLHVILLHYYIERQCLLKCTRRILMHALYAETSSKEGNIIREEALKLISDGLEKKIISVLQELLSASHPDQLDADLYTLWAEETLIEDNLVLDILFLTYYESFCTCNGEQWKRLCSFYKGILSGSYDFGRLAISTEAIQSSYHAKVQLLLILIETLDLENLLQMVHDEMPFRQGTTVFSLTDVQEMDAIISSFNAFELKESGPLILTWAVFLCLISSLPGKEENNVLTEIDHVGYVRQAFEAASLNYFLDILQSDILKESDGPVAGYRSVLRTFVSAFIASYEISLQLEDGTLNLILDILCKIYQGEESLCIQFWDRDSFIDGPIRCLLCNLEGEFPFRTVELVRLLSSLCEGTWPAECVYNFLDKSVGISSMFEISRESLVDNISQIVETRLPLPVPGIEGLLIPSKTRGHILKVIGGNTALVRWEYTQSGVLVLLLHLAQELYTGSNEEILPTLELLSRMVSFNAAICFALMDIGNLLNGQATGINEHVERNMWVVEIICALVRNLSPNSYNAAVMSMSVNILAKMFKCSPSHLTAVVLKTNMFDVTLKTSNFDIGFNGSSGGAWLLSGKLAKMLLIDCEQNDVDCPLILSVLDFTMKLVETGLENDVVLALVVFSLQFVLVNHEYWKYKVKHVRWKVTLKDDKLKLLDVFSVNMVSRILSGLNLYIVLEVMKKCIMSISYYEKLGEIIWDMLLRDSSIHSSLFRVICTTTQALEKLYVSRLIELMEIEGVERAIISVLNVLYMMLSNFSKEISSSLPVFHQAVLSQTTKPIPVVAAVISLISYFLNPAIQVGSAKVLSVLLMLADSLQPYLFGNVCFGLDDKQIADLRHSISFILLEQSVQNEDLFVAVVNLLTSAARYQPAFLVAIFTGENMNVQLSNAGDVKQPTNEASFGPVGTKNSSLVDALVQYVEKCDDLINSNPSILLNVLDLFKTLWQGAVQYTDILDQLISSGKFWKKLSSSISQISSTEAPLLGTLTEEEALSLAHKYQCQSAILEIIAYDIFLQKKLLHPESLVKQAGESKEIIKSAVNTENSKVANHHDLNDVLSTWCKSSVFGCLIKTYTFCEYDNKKISAAKVAAGLLILHVMGKLATGDAGSLSVSLVEKIQVLSKKLSSQPAFSELLAQYSQRGYSEGKELKALILSDLYYHLQGDLEGRNIVPGPFKELSQFILESKFLQTYKHKYGGGLFAFGKDVYLFDVKRIQADLGFDMWDHSEWKSSKAIVEAMLCRMQEANSMVLLASSKFSALKALITILTVYEDDSLEKETTIGRKIPDQLTLSCIDHTCQCFQDTIELLASFLGASEEILDYLAAQAELLLHLTRTVHTSLSLPVCALILKTSGSGLKVLTDSRSSTTGVIITVKLLLLLLLSALEFSYINSSLSVTTDAESVEDFAEICNVSLGLLPILCNCIATAEHCTLSLTAMDLILRNFLTPNTWLPVIQKHLLLQQTVWKLHDKNSLESIPMLLKFFLTLARVRGSAEMLFNAGFLSSVKVLFADLSDGRPSLVNEERRLSNSTEKIEKTQNIWGLGLAVIIAMVHSLGDSSSYIDIVNNVIPFFFSEKGYLISCYLNAPYFPSDDHDKKRPRAQRTRTSLTALQETEHTLMLMCVLARQWKSWDKATKELDSSLREKSIHLLAFISRGTQRLGESPSRSAPLLCPPILKEEFDWCKKPSFVNSRNGWFALAPHCCLPKPNFSTVSVVTSALIVKDRATENTNHVSQTYFSDTIALQIYRIAFLLLKFLCLQAESAAKRAEEVGFVDLAHFPELPMPEILHGIQDQTITIVSELCDAHKLKQVNPEIQSLCLAQVQIMEMALYLELCVLQICGIRPVLGRMEDFSKEVKLLIKTTEGHVFLKESMKSLKQIISLVYPGFLQTEGVL